MDDAHISLEEHKMEDTPRCLLRDYTDPPVSDRSRDHRNASDADWTDGYHTCILTDFDVPIHGRPDDSASQLIFTPYRRYELWNLNSPEEPPSFAGCGPANPAYRQETLFTELPKPLDGRLERRFDPTVGPQQFMSKYAHYPFITQRPRTVQTPTP